MRKLSISLLAVVPLFLAGAAITNAQQQNPVKPTLAVIEDSGRIFRYDCEMCHGADGSGKGDLAQDMKLETHDWRTGSVIEKMTDEEIFNIITKGKGKMVPEGERVKPEIRWGLVHYVRLLARKGGGGGAPAIGKPAATVEPKPVEAPKPAAEAPKPPADAPKPAAEEPKPAEAPKPAAEEPKPAETPKPAAEAPKPPADAPKPAADAPKPPADQPKPPADEPKPAADAPKPPADQPKPPVG